MHHDIKLLRKNWKPSTKKKPKESSYKRVCAGMNTGKKARSIFLIWRKEITPKKHIRKLFISGVIKTDPFCILKEQERFYRDLYKSKTNDPEISQKISAFLNDLNIPKLYEEQQKQREGLFHQRNTFVY